MTSAPFDLVLRSRRTILPEGTVPAAVCVTGDRISAVLPYSAPVTATDERDLGDLALLPGLVDTHVHVNEPGRTEWEGFASATRAKPSHSVRPDRKSTRLNSSHTVISYAVFCLKKKKN